MINLIITRPTEQAQPLIAELNQLADNNSLLQITHLPLLAIEPIDFNLTIKPFDGIIFISGHAAKYFFQRVTLTDLNKTKLLAVGENTANKIKNFSGQTALFPKIMNTEGLLQLEAIQSVNRQDWLIVKGEGGRQTLRETLQIRGAKITELNVYKRQLPSAKIQQTIIQMSQKDSDKAIWLISSAEAMTHLEKILNLMDKSQHLTQVIVTSDRLAELARQKGFTIFAQSLGASQQQLVECIRLLVDDS